MIEFLMIAIVVTATLGPLALWASWNHTNATEYIEKKIDTIYNFCPYKYRWQLADDLGMRDEDSKFSYLMTMPKESVKELWLIETNI